MTEDVCMWLKMCVEDVCKEMGLGNTLSYLSDSQNDT